MKNKVKLATLMMGLLVGGVAFADNPGPAIPFDAEVGQEGPLASTPPLELEVLGGSVAALPFPLQDGADHIIAQQCGVGGFCWPHGSACCPAAPNNVSAPIARGILAAYSKTGDPAHLVAAAAAGGYDLTSAFPNASPAFGSHTPGFLHELTQLTGVASYSTFAETGFFDALTAGTYGDVTAPGWAAFAPADTYDFIARHKSLRSGGLINLRPWDMQFMPWVAGMIGNADSTTPLDSVSQQTTFLNLSILDGLDTLDNTTPVAGPWWDVLGLAGGVHALALNGTTTFPAITAPKFTAIDTINNLCGLTAVLAGFQNGNGSWYWASALGAPIASDEDTQTTAYAVMALEAADGLCAANYSTAITDGRNWLLSMQFVSGGFEDYPTAGSENVEVEGESLSALFTASACGNGVVDFGEVCDDGNTNDGDSCRADCSAVGAPTMTGWGMAALLMVLLAGLTFKIRQVFVKA